jgi:hypothetical protein|tara:strand:+ start:186 stop:584 length:399 start_codon:yes stop_codon:yes gene_type:complete
LREYLATSPLDLLNLYTEFRATPAGADIGVDAFVRMPLKLIHELIRLGGEREKRVANIGSITTAKLTGIILTIAQSFSKKKATPPSIDAYLPFPIEEDNAFMIETKEIYKRLIAQRKLPLHVIADLNKVVSP